MLRDELFGLEELAGRPSDWETHSAAVAARVRNAWSAAVFSTKDDGALLRYYRYHMHKMVAALEKQPDSGESPYIVMLCNLLTQLLAECPALSTENINVPFHWLRHWRAGVMDRYRQAKNLLSSIASPGGPAEALLSFLTDIITVSRVRFRFSVLAAAERLLNAALDLKPVAGAEAVLADILEQHNFNHLGYFSYRCCRMKIALKALPDQSARLAMLRQEIFRAGAYRPLYPPCLPEWPPLTVMIGTWLEEEKALVQQESSEKIRLNISVAHLAFWLRILHEQDIFGDISLMSLFRGTASCCSTKRQPDVSVGSLSKAYYCPSQVTAGKVLAVLKRMTTRINNQFFPR